MHAARCSPAFPSVHARGGPSLNAGRSDAVVLHAGRSMLVVIVPASKSASPSQGTDPHATSGAQSPVTPSQAGIPASMAQDPASDGVLGASVELPSDVVVDVSL